MRKANSYNTGIASEYYILAQLYRLGYEAYVSLGNKKSIDIRIVKDEKTVTLDVKAVQGYSSLIVNNLTYKASHFVAFVIYNNKFEDLKFVPEVYIMSSLDVKTIEKSFKDQKRVFKGELQPFKDNWKCLFE
jgi:hypothetical protein